MESKPSRNGGLNAWRRGSKRNNPGGCREGSVFSVAPVFIGRPERAEPVTTKENYGLGCKHVFLPRTTEKRGRWHRFSATGTSNIRRRRQPHTVRSSTRLMLPGARFESIGWLRTSGSSTLLDCYLFCSW